MQQLILDQGQKTKINMKTLKPISTYTQKIKKLEIDKFRLERENRKLKKENESLEKEIRRLKSLLKD